MPEDYQVHREEVLETDEVRNAMLPLLELLPHGHQFQEVKQFLPYI